MENSEVNGYVSNRVNNYLAYKNIVMLFGIYKNFSRKDFKIFMFKIEYTRIFTELLIEILC